LIVISIEGLGFDSQHVIREDVAKAPRMSFQEIHSKAQSLGDKQRESHRMLTRQRQVLDPAKIPGISTVPGITHGT